ncbi:DUF1583 domain-containing protein [Planctomycetes bacterium K23_9]|uniref:Uncharacterized protein n=1 Tax=Stieleria marina TaxID=1930275 RepID=A0A517NNL6_9BACT|nr:hypothetical protein K239x_06450 [Planctomycetes bacterium K23_9]
MNGRRLCVVLWVATFSLSEIGAQSPRSDAASLQALFEESTICENVVQLCRRCQGLSDTDRYTALVNWVLPNATRQNLRLRGGFDRSERLPGQREQVSLDPTASFRMYPEYDWIVSPAKDMVRLAVKIDKQAELRTSIEKLSSVAPQQKRSCDALLCLLALAEHDEAAAAEYSRTLFPTSKQLAVAKMSLRDLWIDVLVLSEMAACRSVESVPEPELFDRYVGLSEVHDNGQLDLLCDFVKLIRDYCWLAKLRVPKDQSIGLKDFVPLNLTTAKTHGEGRPLARFVLVDGVARKIGGHCVDALAYRSPMQGSFEIAAELRRNRGRSAAVFAQNQFVAVGAQSNQFMTGALNRPPQQMTIAPPMETFLSSLHGRVAIAGDGSRHSINGRFLDTGSVASGVLPWAGFLSERRNDFAVENVQIAGTPMVPHSIDLLASPKLAGWLRYFDDATTRDVESDDSVTDPVTWQIRRQPPSEPMLIAESDRRAVGSFREDLLRYVRPMVEDGTIEYDFFYHAPTQHSAQHTERPAQQFVHPALGRSVFLLTDDQIKFHQLTDGLHDQTSLRPDNSGDFPPGTWTADSVALNQNAWNHVALSIAGTQLVIRVNQEVVLKQPLSDFNSRLFGLFRFADQSSVKVKNVKWTGDWPGQVEIAQDRSLTPQAVTEINQWSKQLPDRWERDFRKGYSPRWFDFGGNRETIQSVTKGIRLHKTMQDGIGDMRACVRLEGDFDLAVTYQDLEISTEKPTWHSGNGLMIRFDNPLRDQVSLYRRVDRMGGMHCVAFAVKRLTPGGKAKFMGGTHVVDESTSGTHRLVRKDGKLLALHAIDDSECFRVIGEIDAPQGPVEIQGIRMVNHVGKGSRTSTTWSRLRIAGERIDRSDVDANATKKLVDELQQWRLNQSLLEADFSSPAAAGSSRWQRTGDAVFTANAQGCLMSLTATDNFDQAGMVLSDDLGRNFDVQIDFDIDQMDLPTKSRAHSEVALQVLFKIDALAVQGLQPVSEASILFRRDANGNDFIRPRVVGPTQYQSTVYRPIRTIPTKPVSMMRIVAKEGTLVFMSKTVEDPSFEVLATYPFPVGATAHLARFYATAAGEGCVVNVNWKRALVATAVPIATTDRP